MLPALFVFFGGVALAAGALVARQEAYRSVGGALLGLGVALLLREIVASGIIIGRTL